MRQQQQGKKIEVSTMVSSQIEEKAAVEEVWFEGRPAFQIHYFDKISKDKILHEIITGENATTVYKLIPADNENLRKGTVIIPEASLELERANFGDLWRLQDELLQAGFDAVNEKEEARLMMRICTSSWFLDKEETGIAGMGKFAPIIPIRGLSGGGKNRLLNILRWCSYHPFYQLCTSKIPSIYRPLELWKGVLALDECDVDVDKEKELVGFLLSRSYGNPISRQNPQNISESNSFNNFQLTLATQRQPWGENALEGRSIPFYAEKSWEKLPTLETPVMIELGKRIQQLSLALRMKYWDKVDIDKAQWLDTTDARLNSALLPLSALSKFDCSIMPLLERLLKKIERRKISLKAASDDGILVNYLHSKIEDGLYRPYSDGVTSYVLDAVIERETKDSKEGKDAPEQVEVPLTTTRLKDDLGFHSAKQVRQRLDGMMHLDDLPENPRIGGKKVRAVFFRNAQLLKLFKEFVPDFKFEECPLNKIKGLDTFVQGNSSNEGKKDYAKAKSGTDGTDGTLPSMPSPLQKDAYDTSTSVPSVPSVPDAGAKKHVTDSTVDKSKTAVKEVQTPASQIHEEMKKHPDETIQSIERRLNPAPWRPDLEWGRITKDGVTYLRCKKHQDSGPHDGCFKVPEEWEKHIVDVHSKDGSLKRR